MIQQAREKAGNMFSHKVYDRKKIETGRLDLWS